MQRLVSGKVVLLLLLLLLLAVGGAIGLGATARHYYLQLNSTRLDPLGIAAYPPEANVPAKRAGKKRALFFGDSRAYYWPTPTALSQFEFLNRGIGSQTTTQVLARFDAHVTPLQPDLIIVQVGINDLKTIPLFPTQKATIIANCKANLVTIVERSTALGAIVILTTIFPHGQVSLQRRPFWSGDVQEAIVEVNAYLFTLAGERVIIFDSAQLLADDDGLLRADYAYDLLHLNTVGYEALNLGLIEVLEKLGNKH
jgi:lysophospholipase L1-like esterase